MANNEHLKLSEVIGGLAASIVTARGVADMEALRIAYRYRENEFLKGMPVPRLRIQKVSINIPIIVADVVPEKAAQARHQSEIAFTVLRTLASVKEECLAQLQTRVALKHIPDAEQRSVRRLWRMLSSLSYDEPTEVTKLGKRIGAAFAKIGVAGSDTVDARAPHDVIIREAAVTAVCDYFTELVKETAFSYVEKRVDQDLNEHEKEQSRFDPQRARNWYEDEVSRSEFVLLGLQRLSDEAARVCVSAVTEPPDVEVVVNTDRIKEQSGGADSVTRLDLVFREEGLEWLHETTEAGRIARLVPE